jgi:hypothetical protein
MYINADALQRRLRRGRSTSNKDLMIATQRPITLQAFTDQSASATCKTIPSWSLVATQDNAIGTANAEFIVQRTVTEGKGHVTEVNASHAVLVSYPDAVTDLVRSADRTPAMATS